MDIVASRCDQRDLLGQPVVAVPGANRIHGRRGSADFHLIGTRCRRTATLGMTAELGRVVIVSRGAPDYLATFGQPDRHAGDPNALLVVIAAAEEIGRVVSLLERPELVSLQPGLDCRRIVVDQTARPSQRAGIVHRAVDDAYDLVGLFDQWHSRGRRGPRETGDVEGCRHGGPYGTGHLHVRHGTIDFDGHVSCRGSVRARKEIHRQGGIECVDQFVFWIEGPVDNVDQLPVVRQAAVAVHAHVDPRGAGDGGVDRSGHLGWGHRVVEGDRHVAGDSCRSQVHIFKLETDLGAPFVAQSKPLAVGQLPARRRRDRQICVELEDLPGDTEHVAVLDAPTLDAAQLVASRIRIGDVELARRAEIDP